MSYPPPCCPAGRSSDGLPVGVQILGPEDSEPVLLRAGRAIETRGDRAYLAREHALEFEWPMKR